MAATIFGGILLVYLQHINIHLRFRNAYTKLFIFAIKLALRNKACFTSHRKFANSWNGLFNCKSLETTYSLFMAFQIQWFGQFSTSFVCWQSLFYFHELCCLFYIKTLNYWWFITKNWMIMIHHHDASYSLNFLCLHLLVLCLL